jgi:hypothetical protein
LRKLALLVVGVALMAGTLSACLGGPPPPPPTDPHDVVVVGDSVSFSFGCVLGDAIPGFDPSNCPQRPGYTTKNLSVGACTIYPTQVLLYNNGRAGVPNCNTTAAPPDNRTWAEAADYYTPKVVVINTSGWEIVDRWVSDFSGAPDSQWGAPGCTPQNVPPSCTTYQTAAVQYSSALFNAINAFRARNATVVVTNAPYIAPPEPEPAPSGSIDPGIWCAWWEPNPSTAPSASPTEGQSQHCKGDATSGTGGPWRAPCCSLTYRSSQAKLNQFNDIITLVKNANFPNDPGVKIFNFKSHFNDGPNNQYSDYVCPPPHDTDTAAQSLPDADPNSPTFGQNVMQCMVGADPTQFPKAILARAPDKGHLSVRGEFQVLQPYIEPCVKALLGIGGDVTKCS